MDSLDDLKAIWHTAKTDVLPSSGEMLQLIRRFRSQKLRSKWIMIILSLLLAATEVGAMYFAHFKLLATYLGGGLITASSLGLAATNIRSIKRFYQLDDCSNLEFVAFIEQTRQNQIHYYKKTQVVILMMCSAGLLMYLYEMASKRPEWFIAMYAICVVYLLILWLVVRPYYFKRQSAKLNATLQRLEKLSNQLK